MDTILPLEQADIRWSVLDLTLVTHCNKLQCVSERIGEVDRGMPGWS